MTQARVSPRKRLKQPGPTDAMLKKALGHMFSCKDISRLVSQGQDREFGRWERWKLRLHLAACDACARFEDQMRFLREAMRRYRS
jgi:hypothetical protein